MSAPDPKTCAACGRTIEWRKKWERDWPTVKYCSKGCRRHRLDDTDHALEQVIGDLLAERARNATICPSEAARAVAAADGHTGDEWRELMEPARRAARRLVAVGDIVITQKGKVVDPSTAKGPIRLRRA